MDVEIHKKILASFVRVMFFLLNYVLRKRFKKIKFPEVHEAGSWYLKALWLPKSSNWIKVFCPYLFTTAYKEVKKETFVIYKFLALKLCTSTDI